jgi:aspartate racemase
LLIIERLAERDAEGIITGCTEIELLVTSDDAGLPYIPPSCTPSTAAAIEAVTWG